MAGLETDKDIYAGLAEAKKDEYADRRVDSSEKSVSCEDDLEYPTEEEFSTLRSTPDHVPWGAYLICVVEMAERFSYYGSTVVFTNFIQQHLPPGSRTGAGGAGGQSGALGLGQRASTGLVTFNSFWQYITPLVGGWIADTYLGRFRTICYALIFSLIGHIILIISGTPVVIKNPQGAAAAFAIAIITIGCGTGGFKSNLSPLVAEQYRHTKPYIREKEDGSRIIVDPVLTASRIYMYFYLFTNIGALVGQIGMTYAEKYVGFWLAYTLPTAIFLLCPIVLLMGHKRYVCSPPSGSVLSKALRAWKLAAKGRWSFNPVKFIRNFRAANFWDQAKPSHLDASSQPKPRWMTYDDNWIDELRRGFKACSVFVWYPIYWLTYNQCNSNLVSQAATMSTHGLPNDILSNLDPLALIILIPICDRIIYPALRRAGIRLTPIRKITMGFYTGTAAMTWAAVVQHYVYKTNPCGYAAATCVDDAGHLLVSPLNVWIQSGSYILIAISEILAIITGLEYAFTKAPKNMRSLVTAVFLAMNAFSSALGEAFVSLSADPLLVWNYGSMGVLAFVAGTIFWFQFRHLDQEEEALNALAVGRVNGVKVESDPAP